VSEDALGEGMGFGFRDAGVGGEGEELGDEFGFGEGFSVLPVM